PAVPPASSAHLCPAVRPLAPPTCAQQITHLCPAVHPPVPLCSATYLCPEVPPTCAHQCHPPVPTHQCCPPVPPTSAAQQCYHQCRQSVPSSDASQCRLSIPIISVTYQCRLSV
ncbi:unnamed protein product, partial [Staurois parvus]